ncbi:hypothetical protein BDQ12DRAFT_725932 [Crucibulum laeve]|uniref:Uncharacterized protein n=1 Tax=Crucibulum laeve TaxID=68775 RepID=A0A5C3LRB8_9AGAR|nr:hypothetical protein BDQ12DRAFT_725932 [Crucibulum laeve]
MSSPMCCVLTSIPTSPKSKKSKTAEAGETSSNTAVIQSSIKPHSIKKKPIPVQITNNESEVEEQTQTLPLTYVLHLLVKESNLKQEFNDQYKLDVDQDSDQLSTDTLEICKMNKRDSKGTIYSRDNHLQHCLPVKKLTFGDILPSKDSASSSVQLSAPVSPLLQSDLTTQVIKSLPDKCKVMQNDLMDPYLAEYYVNLPPLCLGTLVSWKGVTVQFTTRFSGWGEHNLNMELQPALDALNFMHSGRYINMSRVDPHLLSAMETSANGSCFQVKKSGKICIGLASGFVLRANTKFPCNKGLKVKEISIIMHTLEYEQFSAVICMLMHKDQVIAQISDNTISFTIKATKYENEWSCNIPPNMFNKVTSPVMPKKSGLLSKFSSRFQKAVHNSQSLTDGKPMSSGHIMRI